MRNNEIVPRLTPSPVLGEGWGEGVKNKTSTILHGQAVDNVQTCIVIEPDHMITVQTMFGICMLSNRSPVEKPLTGDAVLARVRSEAQPLVMIPLTNRALHGRHKSFSR